MTSVGIGWVNTLNAPPGTTGQIPPALVANMATFGTALKKLLRPVSERASITGPVSLSCSNGTEACDVGQYRVGEAAHAAHHHG